MSWRGREGRQGLTDVGGKVEHVVEILVIAADIFFGQQGRGTQRVTSKDLGVAGGAVHSGDHRVGSGAETHGLGILPL